MASTLGPPDASSSVDYPDVAGEVCAPCPSAREFRPVGLGPVRGWRGANKVPGIAGVVSDPFSARMLRAHNDANVLCVGERVLGTELAKVVLDAFVAQDFEGGRHQRRVSKIEPAGAGD